MISHACALEVSVRERDRQRERKVRGSNAAMYCTYHHNDRDDHNHRNDRSSGTSNTLAAVTVKPALSDIPSLAPAYELFTLSTQILSLFPQ